MSNFMTLSSDRAVNLISYLASFAQGAMENGHLTSDEIRATTIGEFVDSMVGTFTNQEIANLGGYLLFNDSFQGMYALKPDGFKKRA